MIPEEKEWFAVIGCKDGRIEVMTGVDYRANPVNLRECIWLRAVVKSEAIPNAATAVYRAAFSQVPSEKISQALTNRLSERDWTLEADEAEMFEEIDHFLAEECGVGSIFEGLKKIKEKSEFFENDRCDIRWEESLDG